eukprot:7066287-Pyramimonas_sp.AAC.1
MRPSGGSLLMSEHVSTSTPLPRSGSPRSALSKSSRVHTLSSVPRAELLRVCRMDACCSCGSL